MGENNYPLVYLNSRNYAIKNDEMNLWRESRTLDGECASAIDSIIGNGEKYDAKQLDTLLWEIDSLLNKYGNDRVSFVLAETVDTLRNNNGISDENRDWADAQELPHYSSVLDTYGCILQNRTNTTVLNDFIGVFRQRLEDREKETSVIKEPPEKSEFEDLREFYNAQVKYAKELREDLNRVRKYAVKNGHVPGDRVDFDQSQYWFRVEIFDADGQIYPYYFSCNSLSNLKESISWAVNETKFYEVIAFVKDRTPVTFTSQKDIDRDFDNYYHDYYRFSEDVCETYSDLFDRTFTGEQMEKIYQVLIDKKEYPQFDDWKQDMCRSGLIYGCHKNYTPVRKKTEGQSEERNQAEVEESCMKRKGR